MRAIPLILIALASSLEAAEPLEIKLWPEGAPGQMLPHSKATEDFIRTKSGKSTITDIHEPTITVFRPEKPNGTSVIVAPGGGFVFLSATHEGTQVCEWLNTIGVTGILLKYRTPTRDEAAPHEKPVADAAKAISIVREHAKEWKLNPDRIGLLGFSAGGNLLAHIACDRPAAAALPNFGVMIYGGGFVDYKEPTKLKEGFTVPADAPPMFLACAHDDGQNPTAATVLYLEYKKRNLSAELHLFTKGGHGFGMRDNKQPINAWPQRCAEWMDAMGWLPTKEKLDASISKKQSLIVETYGAALSSLKRSIADGRVSNPEIDALTTKIRKMRFTDQSWQVPALQARRESLEKAAARGDPIETGKPMDVHDAIRKAEVLNRDIEVLRMQRKQLVGWQPE